MPMQGNNPRLMDAQLASYLKRFAENKSDDERTELSMAFYAGAISLQRVEKHVAEAAAQGKTLNAQFIAQAITDEIEDAARRLLTGRIVPCENVRPG